MGLLNIIRDLCISLLLFLFFGTAFAEITFPLSAAEKTRAQEQEEEFPMNWEKSTVSRGFGNSIPDLAERLDLAQQFKSGEVAYFFRNYEKAMSLWLPLAESGLADAQTNIGWIYQRGLGVEIDLQKAKFWYLKAVGQNHSIAQNNLGAMYEHGLGVAQDNELAFEYYRLAAKNDYRFAYYNLGSAYLNGIGTKIDKKAAKYWLQKAVDNKVEQANKLLRNIN